MRKVDKNILRLSLPAIVSNITVPLLGLCDTAISGHLGSELYLAAIAVGSVMLNVVFWLFGFLRAGTTGMTAIAYGAKDPEGVSRVFSRALFLGLAGGAVIILLRVPLMKILLLVVDAEPEVTEFVERYFSIAIWSAPAILGTMALSGWFVGMQSTVYPMAISITVNVINIVMSLVFVYRCGLGFEGVAMGTLCANWAGMAVAGLCVVKFYRGGKLWCGFAGLIKGGGLGRFFSVNSNLFVRSACIISVSLGVASAGARLGSLTLAVNVIIMQLFQFFSFFMDGFAFSAEAMVGKYIGSGDREGLRIATEAHLKWTLGMSLLFTAVYFFGCEAIAGVLTDRGEVCGGVAELRTWIALIPILSGWAFIYDGFYVGATSTRKMMAATIAATIVFYIIAFIHYDGTSVVAGVGGNRSLWTAFLSYLTLRGVILALQWRRTLATQIGNQHRI